jgi:hypothetical protein
MSHIPPHLDKLNSDFFVKTPPEVILYEFASLGALYPIFYEPKTLVTLLQNYSLRVRSGDYLFLERNLKRVSAFKKIPLKEVKVRWGEPVVVPEFNEGYVFAVIDIDVSMYGKIIKSLLRPSQIFIKFVVSDSGGRNQIFKYKFVRALGTEGLLVSDHVADLDQLEKLFQGEQRRDVSEFVLVPETSSHFDPQMDITFYGVPKNEIILNEEVGSRS